MYIRFKGRGPLDEVCIEVFYRSVKPFKLFMCTYLNTNIDVNMFLFHIQDYVK